MKPIHYISTVELIGEITNNTQCIMTTDLTPGIRYPNICARIWFTLKRKLPRVPIDWALASRSEGTLRLMKYHHKNPEKSCVIVEWPARIN